MPAYPTLDSLPNAKCLETWLAFNARLIAPVEMGWLNGRILRHDIPALRKEDSPLLSVVKVADDWERTALGRKPPYNATYDFGVRLYFYVDSGTVEETEAQYDLLERANEVVVRILRSEYMACNEPYWKELFLMGGEKNGRTSVINRVKERLYITTRIRLLRHYRPGQ